MTASQSYIGQISHNNENEKIKLNHFSPLFSISFIRRVKETNKWMRGSNFQRTYYIYVHTNKLPIHASIYALDHSQVLYIYYKLLQCRCLHFIETRIQILHYSSRKQVHSIIQTNLNANCSSISLLCFYIDVYIYVVGNF